MAINVEIINDGQGVISTGKGTLTSNDIMVIGQKAFAKDEDIKKIKYCLDDFSQIDAVDISNNAIQEVIFQDKHASILNPNIVVAVVANKDILFGLARMWQSYAEIKEMKWKIFTTRSLDQAKDWICEQTGLVVK